MRQLARAVVDIELHHHSVTQEEAREFYTARAGMSPEAAQKEVTRNSMFPGTAVMYLMGTDAIHGLREEMMAREGSDFDLGRFHDAYLSSARQLRIALPGAARSTEVKP